MFKSNSLVCYQGGGYDGCFWELNYAYINPNGEFVNIYSSGYKGCDTLEKLIAFYQKDPKKFDIYELDKESGIRRAADQLPIHHLVRLAEILSDIQFRPKCNTCGKRFPVEELVPEGMIGNGGIGWEFKTFQCPKHREEDDL